MFLAPGIFQKAMETLLQGIPHVSVYIDDILVTGETEDDHLKTLEIGLELLKTAGLRSKDRKVSVYGVLCGVSRIRD